MSAWMMDALTAFSPNLDLLAVATTDGRIKTWDVESGHLRGEFVDVSVSTRAADLIADGNGHLSVNYSWKRKGRKNEGQLLLALGTAGGDVFGWDVALGELKWKTSDCNAGGVNALATSKCGKIIYAAGADGMICEVESETGEVLGRFRASKSAVSRIAVSPDGNVLLTASSQLKTFDLSSKKRIRKFSGHPGDVTALAFSQDETYVLSSSKEERQVSVWLNKSTTTDIQTVYSLICEQSVVFLDGTAFHPDAESFRVLGISEGGMAYVWHASSMEELTKKKPSTVSVGRKSKTSKSVHAYVLAALLIRGESTDSVSVRIAYGTSAKPSMEKLSIKGMGSSLVLEADAGSTLLPVARQVQTAAVQGTDVTVLGPASAPDAVNSKVHLEIYDANAPIVAGKRPASVDLEDDGNVPPVSIEGEQVDTMDVENEPTMEERLISLGIMEKEPTSPGKSEALVKVVPPRADSLQVLLSQALQSDDSSLLERCFAVQDEKLVQATVRKLRPSEACKFLNSCVARLETHPRQGMVLVSWIRATLLQHSASIMTNLSMQPVLTTLFQHIEARMVIFRPLLALSGRLNLVTAQIEGQELGKVEDTEEVIEAVVYEEGDSDIEVEEVDQGEDTDETDVSDSDREARGSEAGILIVRWKSYPVKDEGIPYPLYGI